MLTITLSHIQKVVKERALFKELLIAFLGSMVLAIGSQIAIPLPFTLVPLSCQTLSVMLLAVTLRKRSLWAISLYLLEGAIGLPVFANGAFGAAYLLGPTGGYLWLFPLQAYFTGVLLDRTRNLNRYKMFAILAVVSLLHMLGGSLWLSSFVGLEYALKMGFFPFLIGDFLKVSLVTFLYKKNQIKKFI